jgi:hypothetical protein
VVGVSVGGEYIEEWSCDSGSRAEEAGAGIENKTKLRNEITCRVAHLGGVEPASAQADDLHRC